MKAAGRTNWFWQAASIGILAAAALALPNVGFAKGRTIGPTSTITAASATEFGYSIASTTLADGSTIVVIGAPTANNGAGAAYVYTEAAGSSWTTPLGPDVLTAATSQSGSGFGDSVAISNDGQTIVVGAPNATVTNASGTTITNAGVAYVFNATNLGWPGGSTPSNQILTASDGAAGDMFGISVGVGNNVGSIASPIFTVVVGADGHTVSAQASAGAAYVIPETANGPGTVTEITDPGATANDLFGDSVAITSDGSTIIVGASGSTSNAGEAYVFSGSSWSTAATLFASGSTGFGTSVSIGGTTSGGATAVVGAPGTASSAGSAYVFASSTAGWSMTPVANLTMGTNGDFLGKSVAISGDGSTIAVGAPDAPSTSSPTPTIYEFDAPTKGKNPGSWTGHIKSFTYQPSNTTQTAPTYFGDAVAVGISSGTPWVFGGAYGVSLTSGSGEAFVFAQ